jgi:hypothetical protein
MMFGICTYTMTGISSIGCLYVKVGGAVDASIRFPNISFSFSRGLGLFSYQEPLRKGLSCVYYSPDQIAFLDGAFRAARVFGHIANFFTGSAALMLLAIGCIDFSDVAVNAIGLMLLVGALFSLLTFTLFASKICDFDCDFSSGAGLALAAALSGSATAFLVFKIPPVPSTNSLA